MTDPKETLQAARNIQRRIDRRQAELRRLREMETYLRATDYASVVVAHSAGRGPVEQAALGSRLETMERCIRQDIAALTEAKLEAVALIGLLEDPRMTEILWEYYIHGVRTWDDVSEAVGYSRQYVTKLHGGALQLLREKMRLNASFSS